jgi:ferredoxin
MNNIDRRTFFKLISSGIVGAVGGKLVTPGIAWAKGTNFHSDEFYGILVDTTRCIGCRRCEKACAEANNLPVLMILRSLTMNDKPVLSSGMWLTVLKLKKEQFLSPDGVCIVIKPPVLLPVW